MQDIRKLLTLARAAMAKGDLAGARRLAQAARTRGGGRAVQLVLASIAGREGDWAEVDRLVPSRPAHPDLLRLRWKAARALGRVEEAHASATALAAARPDDLGLVERLAESYDRMGDPAAARAFLAPAIARHPDARGLHERDLRLRVQEEDPTLADALIAAPPRDPSSRSLAVEALVGLGRPAAACALAATGDAPSLRIWRARFALWAGDTTAARAQLSGLEGADAARTRAAAAALDGDPGAVAALEAVVAASPDDGVAWAWLAEALEAAGRFDEAETAADRAMSAEGGFNLVARMTRLIAITDGAGLELGVGAAEIAEQLAPLGVPTDGATLAQFRDARARFGGNRTPTLTILGEGQLRAYPRPPDPRDLAQGSQKLLVTRGRHAALAALTALHERFHGHPLLHTYRGEIHLWGGEYDEAAADFEASLAGDRHTKWAWIGLGATRLLRGDPQGALDTFSEGVGVTGFAGPTLFIYKAEALLRLGRRDAALEALHVARQTKPKRLSTWMHLAMLAADDGDPRPAEALVALVAERLPGLAHDRPGGEAPERLRGWLGAMLGNRSSGMITWVNAEGRHRAGTWSPLPADVIATFPAALRGG